MRKGHFYPWWHGTHCSGILIIQVAGMKEAICNRYCALWVRYVIYRTRGVAETLIQHEVKPSAVSASRPHTEYRKSRNARKNAHYLLYCYLQVWPSVSWPPERCRADNVRALITAYSTPCAHTVRHVMGTSLRLLIYRWNLWSAHASHNKYQCMPCVEITVDAWPQGWGMQIQAWWPRYHGLLGFTGGKSTQL